MNRVERHEAEKRTAQRRKLISEGFSEQEADAELAARDRREDAVRWLHGQLFAEEYDEMGDSYADLRDREQGINPLCTDDLVRIAAKREALGVPPLNSAGIAVGNEARVLCEALVDGVVQRL